MSKTGITSMPLLGRSLSVGTPSSKATIRIALLASILLIYALVCQSRNAPLSSLVTMARQMRLPDSDILSNSRLSEAEELLRRTDPAARQLLDMARAWPVPQAPYKLGLCAMAKNEAAYLEEWILYHYFLGFDHFVIQDHHSTDATIDILAPYIKAGLVEVQPVDPNATLLEIEYHMHRRCFNGTAIDTDWVATFDVDEMLTSTFRPRLDVGFRPTPLMNWFDSRRQQQQSVVVVSRFNFGPSNRTDPPPAPLGQGDWFTERILEDHAVAMSGPKSIGRIGFMTFERLWAHHWLDPIDGWSRVQANGVQAVEFDKTVPVPEPIHLSHYETRSVRECVDKVNDPGQAGTWRVTNNQTGVCTARMAGDPQYKPHWMTQDFTQRDSIYNQAARLARSQGGLFPRDKEGT